MGIPIKFIEWYDWVKTIREMPPIEVAYQQHLNDEAVEDDKRNRELKRKEEEKRDQDYRDAMNNNYAGG